MSIHVQLGMLSPGYGGFGGTSPAVGMIFPGYRDSEVPASSGRGRCFQEEGGKKGRGGRMEEDNDDEEKEENTDRAFTNR